MIKLIHVFHIASYMLATDVQVEKKDYIFTKEIQT